MEGPMKNYISPVIGLFALGLVLFVGCMRNYSPTSSGYGGGYGGGGGTPAPSSVYTLTVIPNSGSYRYSTNGSAPLSAPLTITHGQSITWDSSNGGIHPLYLDNGSTCIVSSPQPSYPYTYMFSTAGTYNFHCGNHGSCSPSNTTCPGATCTGMYGTIVVQ